MEGCKNWDSVKLDVGICDYRNVKFFKWGDYLCLVSIMFRFIVKIIYIYI